MKTTLHRAALAAVLLVNAAQLQAQSTAFTYQGRLAASGVQASGRYDFLFTLYDAASSGNAIGSTLTNTATVVSNGLFTATLDFGNAFPGAARWLDIAVRTNGTGAFTPITPRQELTPTPYAITAGRVVSGGISGGTYGNAVTFSNAANSFAGTFTGNGAAISNVNAASLGGQPSSAFWQLGGNNVAAGQFLGSTNNQPLELKVGGERVMRFERGAFTNEPNVIGGTVANSVTPGVSGATIGGGGAPQSFFAGPNTVASDYGTVGGGEINHIGGPNAIFSTIAGGWANGIGTNAAYTSIGGGYLNAITDNGNYGTVAGGYRNIAADSAFAAGHYTHALHSGTFVWADNHESEFASSGINQFLIRAAGGVGINTTNPAATLDVNGSLRVGTNGTIFRHIQGGLAQMSGGSSTAKTNFTFNFTMTFTNIPNVILSARSGNAVPVDDTFAVTVRDVTVSNCTVNIVRVDNPSGWSQAVKINWMAWE